MYQSFPVHICYFPSKVSLTCQLTSSDVSVSALRARLDSPPANRTSPISAAAGKSLFVGLATLESVSFSLGKSVMCSNYSVSMRFAWWWARRD